jgi:hypothetical protein
MDSQSVVLMRRRKSLPHPYQRRDAMLSRGELAFYTVLRRALQGTFGISLKTRLADVVQIPPELWDSPHGWKLSQKHVDFVLYDRQTTGIVAVVELDDRTHDTAVRRRRDRFLDGVLKSVCVPIFHVRAAARYRVMDLRVAFSSILATSPCRIHSR